MKNYIKLCLGLIVNYFFWRGVYDNVINVIPNACEMTYMYEYPEYIEVDVPNNFQNSYKLHAYGEGHYAKLLGRKVFKGIPVLFIPGNQGSSKQVRSLGSVAYRMFQTYSTPFHFNYFAVDFNEEIGALFGPVLDRQTRFVGLAIKTILNLYQNDPNKPQSVILVGHSMGGLVARAVVSLPDISPNLVSIIITEATPHVRPVVALDSALVEFSEHTNSYWDKERYYELKNIVFVTIGGGKSDIQVPSVLTTSEFADIDETLMTAPMCWLTTDHLAIVWCKQLVLAINRALFNSVDKSTLQISTDISRIIKAFKGQLSQKFDEDLSFEAIQQRIGRNGIQKDDLIEVNDFSVKRMKNRLKDQFLVVPLREGAQEERLLTAVFEHVGPKSFLFAGNANNNSGNLMITSGDSLQHQVRSIPGNRKEVNIELLNLKAKGYSHIIAFVQAVNEQTTVSIDVKRKNSYRAAITAPTFLSSFSPISVMKNLPKNSLTLNITIEKFTEFWQSFTLVLTPIGHCSSSVDAQPAVSIKTSWLNRWEYVICRNSKTVSCDLSLDIPSPFIEEGLVEVHVVKSPGCSYSVSLQKNFGGTFERIALLFVSQIPTFVVCHLLLILSKQYKAHANGGKTSFYTHLADLTPISVVPFMKLLAFAIGNFSLVETDKSYLDKARTNFEALPILLFVAALPVTLVLSALFKMLFFGLFNVFRRWSPSFKPKVDIHEAHLSSRLFSVLSLCAVVLLALGASTCGAVALSAAACIYFMKVLGLNINNRVCINHSSTDNCNGSSDATQKDLDEASSKSTDKDLVTSSTRLSDSNDVTATNDSVTEQNSADKNSTTGSETAAATVECPESEACPEESSAEIHFTLMMLVFAIAFLNLPSLIAWAKNLSFEQHLSSDPSLLSSCCIVSSLFLLWNVRIFKPTKKYYNAVGYVLHVNCALILLFGSVRLFRVCEIVSYSFIWISLHQLLAPNK